MHSAPPVTPASAAMSGSTCYVTGVVLVATLGGLLFGYDTAVIAGAIGFLTERFSLTPAWVGWATSSALLGCIIGVPLAGWLSDRFGRKRVLLLSAVLFLVSAVGTALPRSFTEFVIYRLIGGIGVGAASMTSPMYIAEIAPAQLRGRLVSLNQLAIVGGMLLIYFINYFIARQGDEAWNIAVGWRWMFGSESVPALLLLVLLFFVPESPRFLVQNGREDAALEVLSRSMGAGPAASSLNEIRGALAHESGSLRQLLQPGLRRALCVGLSLATLQQITGINVFLYYAPEIFKQVAGASTDTALLQTVVVGAVNLLFTVLAIVTVDRIGRKPLMLVGATGMAISLAAMGFAAYYQHTQAWVLACILTYIASFALAVGPVTWVILSEIFPTRIRGRALALATMALWSANLVVSQTFPILDQHPWLVQQFRHGFAFWLYGGFCVLLMLVVGFWVPETKRRSLEAIEALWDRPVDRRH